MRRFLLAAVVVFCCTGLARAESPPADRAEAAASRAEAAAARAETAAQRVEDAAARLERLADKLGKNERPAKRAAGGR
jgi:hypothetical protein